MTIKAAVYSISRSKVARFLGAGVLNTVFGYTLYAGLVFLGVSYLLALLVATVGGVVFNFFCFGRLVFRGFGGSVVFGKFFVSYCAIYVANAALLSALSRSGYFNAYISQAICVPPSVLLSWFLMNYWVYKTTNGRDFEQKID